MSQALSDFFNDSVVGHELREGTVGKVFHMMYRLGLFELVGPEIKFAWKVMYFTADYAKAPLKKVMSSPEAHDVVKAKLEELRQKRGL